MSAVRLLICLLLISVNSYSLECGMKEEALGLQCEKSKKVRSLEELNAYLSDYGLTNGKAKKLIIAFDISTQENLNIHSPCKVIFKKERTHSLKNLCVNGIQGIRFQANSTISATDISLFSNERIIIRDHAKITANDILLKSNGSTSESRAHIRHSSIITANNLTVEGNSRATLGRTSTYNISNNLTMNSKDEFSAIWKNTTINAKLVTISSQRRNRLSKGVVLVAETVNLNSPECNVENLSVSGVSVGDCFVEGRPVASLTHGSLGINTGEKITFDGSKSADDKGIVEFVFTLDGVEVQRGINPILEYQFNIEGVFFLEMIVSDENGYLSSKRKKITAVKDVLAPIISANNISEQEFTKSEYLLNYAVESNDEATSFVFLNGVEVHSTTNASVSFQINFIEGLNEITIKAVDDSGNNAHDIIFSDIVVDSKVPSFLSLSLTEGEYTNSSPILVTGILDDEVENVLINGKVASIGVDKKSFTYSLNVLQDQLNYPLNVEASDAVGNKVKVDTFINIDKSAPEIINNSLGNTFTNLNNYQLEFSLSDISTTSTTVKLNGNSIESFSGKVISKSLSLVNGVNNIEIVSTDLAGNTSSKIISGINFDNNAPVLSSIQPSNNQNIIGVTSPVSGVSNKPLESVIVNGVQAVIASDKLSFEKEITFPSIGEKEISIVVTDVFGNVANYSRSVHLSAETQNPVALFNISDSSPGLGEKIFLNASSSYDDVQVVKYIWSINDLDPIELIDPKFELDFESVGNYNIKLEVVDDIGLVGSITKVVVAQEKIRPVASFVANVTNVQSPKQVELDASLSTDSDGSIQKYQWFFENSQMIETATPVLNHIFTITGSQKVKLKVIDNDLKESEFEKEVVVNQLPFATFVSSKQVENKNTPISFDASNSIDEKNITSYEWNFGDGVIQQSINSEIEHSYLSSGDYTISVKAFDESNGYGQSISKKIHINHAPSAGFLNVQPTLNAPSFVTFKASGSSDQDGHIVKYEWDLGNGEVITTSESSLAHTFLSEGTKIIKLTVEDNHGATGSYISELTVLPNEVTMANFLASKTFGEAPLSVVFDGGLSYDDEGIDLYDWRINGVSQNFNNEVFQHTFVEKGKYLIELFVTDRQGEVDSKALEIYARGPNEAPVANFVSDIERGNPPLLVRFNASTSSDVDDNLSSYQWSFDDGLSANSRISEVDHTFTKPGVYNVNLEVIDSEGLSHDVTKQIQVNQGPVALFSKDKTTGNPPFEVNFNASSSSDDRTIVEYRWKVGADGEVINGTPEFSHSFLESGIVPITLTVVDDEGLESSISNEVRVNSPPVILGDVYNATGDYPLVSSFDFRSSTDDSLIQSFSFDFGDGSPIIENVQDQSVILT